MGLLHPEDLILLLVELAELVAQLVLAPSPHALVEIGQLPQDLAILTHCVRKEAQVVESVEAFLQLSLQDLDLLNLELVFVPEQLEFVLETVVLVNLGLQGACQT